MKNSRLRSLISPCRPQLVVILTAIAATYLYVGKAGMRTSVGCFERAERFSSRLRKAEPGSTEKLLGELLRRKNPRLTILGEMHFSMAEETLYPKLTRQIRDLTGADCVLLEARNEELIQRNNNPRMISAFRDQGLRLIPVDAAGENVDARTHLIAERVNEVFRSGTCRAAVLIVGKNHLEDVGTGALQPLMTVPFVTIDVVSADFASTGDLPFLPTPEIPKPTPPESSRSKPRTSFKKGANRADREPAEPTAAERAASHRLIVNLVKRASDNGDVIWRQCPADQNVDLAKITGDVAIRTSDLQGIPMTARRRMLDVHKDGPFWSEYDLLILHRDPE